MSEEQRAKRKALCLKLSGLPPNITTRDLHGFLSNIRAKSCFISWNLRSYRPLNYAYVNFASDEDLAIATDNVYTFKGRELYWALENDQVCHVCGSPDHFAASCNSNQNKNTQKHRDLDKLYNRFKPAQHRKPRVSYADMTRNKPPTPSQNQNRNNERQVRSQSPIPQQQQSQNPDMNSLVRAIKDLMEQFKVLQRQVAEVRQDLDDNKQDIININTKLNSQLQPLLTPSTSWEIAQATAAASSSTPQNQNEVHVEKSHIEVRQEAIESSMSRMGTAVNYIASALIRRTSFGTNIKELEGINFNENYDATQNDRYDYDVDDNMCI